MEYKTERITPDIAKKMLTHGNFKNRPLNERHVSLLAKIMTEGEWDESASDPIRIAENGRLIDGQHRLSALIRADKTFDFLVIRNMPERVFDVLDTGKNRSAGDVLAIVGIENYSKIAALARRILSFRGDVSISEIFEQQGIKRHASSTNKKVLDFVQTNDLSEYIKFADARIRQSKLLTHGEWAFLYYLFSKKDETLASEFLCKISSGANIDAGSPEHLLRLKLEQNMMNQMRLPGKHKLALFVKAWNAIRKNTRPKILRFMPDEKLQEIA